MDTNTKQMDTIEYDDVRRKGLARVSGVRLSIFGSLRMALSCQVVFALFVASFVKS